MRPEEYLRVVLRRWWLIPLIALVAAAVAYWYTDRQPRIYNSSTELIAIGEPPNYWNDLLAKNRLASYKKLVTEPRVMQRAVELGHLDQFGLDAGAVAGKIALAHNPDTNAVQIAASDTDPQRAAAIVNAVAKAFIEQNDADNQQQAQEYPRRTDQGTPIPGAIDNVRLEQLGAAGPAAQPSAPRPKLNAAAGFILGAAVALVLIVVLEYFDDTLRTPEDVRRHLGLPTLIGIPTAAGAPRSRRDRDRAAGS
jgi:capsular polysaccharide biosynthesis protein